MSNRRKIKKLKKQIAELKAIITPNSLILTNPDNEKIKIVMKIEGGVFTTDEVIYPADTVISEPTISNINQKEL